MRIEEPPLTVAVVPAADGLRVVLAGELDIETAPEAWERIREAWPEGGTRIELDTARVTFMSSSGLALMIQCSGLLADGSRPTLLSPSPVVMRVVDVAGVQALFEIDQG